MEINNHITAVALARYQKSATGHMRYVLAQKNLLLLHAIDHPLRILDAAGGNGQNTRWLAGQGHSVTLLDSNPTMLDQAKQGLADEGLLGRCQLVEGTIEKVAELFRHGQFDLVLCHHVIEYFNDPRQLLKELHKVTSAKGELSLITLNPVSEVIRANIFQKSPAVAHSKLTDLSYDAKWFGQAMLYSLDQITGWAREVGWSGLDFRGIRILADYVPDAEYDEAKTLEAIQLEAELGGIEPYRRIGRYLQFCFKKEGN